MLNYLVKLNVKTFILDQVYVSNGVMTGSAYEHGGVAIHLDATCDGSGGTSGGNTGGGTGGTGGTSGKDNFIGGAHNLNFVSECIDCSCTNKVDCGVLGTTESECVADGCVWCESNVQGEPWCFNKVIASVTTTAATTTASSGGGKIKITNNAIIIKLIF